MSYTEGVNERNKIEATITGTSGRLDIEQGFSGVWFRTSLGVNDGVYIPADYLPHLTELLSRLDLNFTQKGQQR